MGKQPFITTTPVTREQAAKAADRLDAALKEYANGERRLGNLPLESMAELIQFARDAQGRPTLLEAAVAMREVLFFECREKHHMTPTEEDINPDWHIELTISVGELRSFDRAIKEAIG